MKSYKLKKGRVGVAALRLTVLAALGLAAQRRQWRAAAREAPGRRRGAAVDDRMRRLAPDRTVDGRRVGRRRHRRHRRRPFQHVAAADAAAGRRRRRRRRSLH